MRMWRRAALMVFAPALLVSAGCDAGAHKGATMRVELDAFSGRENPGWSTTDDEGSQLEAAVASLPVSNDQVPESGLGYRGFVLHTANETIRVFKGRVVVETNGAKRVLRDTAGIEVRLLKDARTRGLGEFLAGAESTGH